MYATDLCLEYPKYPIHDRLASLMEVTKEKLVRFNERLVSRMQMEVLVHGNERDGRGNCKVGANPDGRVEVQASVFVATTASGPIGSGNRLREWSNWVREPITSIV
jgi:hypothetical protein